MQSPYVRIAWKPGMFESPNNSDGTVYLHREVASQKLGRKLKPGEVVHHEDENKLNNDPDNLWVFRTTEDHSAYHKQKQLNYQPKLLLNEDNSLSTIKTTLEFKCECGNNKSYDAERCSECHLKLIAKNIPSKEELETLIWKMPTTKVAKLYGVSDKAVEKWCKKYNLSKPPRGYWMKVKTY